MTTAYAYSRYSSPAQAKGDSARRQLEAATRFAEQHGLELDTTLRDLGISAYTGANRVTGALGSFLGRVTAGEIERGSFLLVDSLDRLSRESETRVLSMLTQITLAGIKVVNLAEDHVLDESATMIDYMRVLIHAARANQESKEKGRKVAIAHAEGRRRSRETGAVYTPIGPHWLHLAEGRWIERPERVAVIRRMFDMKEAGLGHAYIATTFNREAVATATGRGVWASATVRDMLRTRTVLGEYQPHTWNGKGRPRTPAGEPISNFYPEIISPEQFHRVQAIIDQRTNPRAAPRSDDFRNLLVGLVRCGTCGGPVGYLRSTFPRNPGWRAAGVLRCNSVYKGTCTNRTRVPYEALEADLLPFIATLPLSSAGRPDEPAERLMELEGQRLGLSAKVQALLDRMEGGSAALAARLSEREGELARIDQEIDRLRRRGAQARSAPPAADAQAALRALADELASAEGEALYTLRARIHASLRKIALGYVLLDGRIDVRLHPRDVIAPTRAGTRANVVRMEEAADKGRLSWTISNRPVEELRAPG